MPTSDVDLILAVQQLTTTLRRLKRMFPRPETMARSWRTAARMRLLGAALGVAALSGCVSRRMTIVSDPPGALVLLEGRQLGYTPVSVDFTYYGTRELTLVKDGYETLTVRQPVVAPWYQAPVVEFFADNLKPGHKTDRHQFRYSLQPARIVPDQELLQRGEMLRGESRVGR